LDKNEIFHFQNIKHEYKCIYTTTTKSPNKSEICNDEEHQAYFRSLAHFITLAYISTHLKTMFGFFLSMKHAPKNTHFQRKGKLVLEGLNES